MNAALRWYEIGFDGDVVEVVHRISPAAHVTGMPTCTILWSDEGAAGALDTLLDTLLALGITPSEVHEAAGDAAYREVRLNGCLGTTMLRYLGWSYRVDKTTVVRLESSHDELRAVLRNMASVTRVDYVLAL